MHGANATIVAGPLNGPWGPTAMSAIQGGPCALPQGNSTTTSAAAAAVDPDAAINKPGPGCRLPVSGLDLWRVLPEGSTVVDLAPMEVRTLEVTLA